MAQLYAGLDVSLEKTSICVVDTNGAIFLQCETQSTPTAISCALKPYRAALARVALETGMFTPWLPKALSRRRFPVVCLDARQTRAALAAQRNKTDKNDARDIAIAISRGFDGRAHLKSDEAQELRALLTYRRTLKRKAKDLEMCLRTTLTSFGIKVSKRGDKLAMLTIGRSFAPTLRRLTQVMLRARVALIAEVRTLDKEIAAIVANDPICRRLMTAPGVGPLTALTFRAGVDDPHRFPSSRLVGAHFGLTPRRVQSGQSDFRGRISKFGDKEVRCALYEAASTMLAVSKRPSKLRSWGLSIRERRGFKLAAVAVARKLATVLHRMWITGTDFSPMPG